MLPHVFLSGVLKVGDVAQLGERDVRNVEARGSIPLISTSFKDSFSCSISATVLFPIGSFFYGDDFIQAGPRRVFTDF